MSLQIHRSGCLQTRPEAVLLDIDNTLYPYDPAHQAGTDAAEKRASKLLGIPVKEFREAFDTARGQIKGQLGKTASSHSRLLYFQRAIEILGMKSQLLMTLDLEQTYWRTFLTTSALFPDVREFLLDLRSSGIRIAIVTDLTAQIQFRKLIYFGIDTMFDYVVTSEEAGLDKPAPAPFQIVLDKLQVAPEKCWMIGDSASSDIAGSKAFGITALQKRHHGVKLATGDKIADVVFDDFRDLRDIVNGQGWVQEFDKAHA